MAFSISHTVSTLNQYNPSSRALGIILVSRVNTDAILKKPYDILYLITPNVNVEKRIDDRDVTTVQSDRVFLSNITAERVNKGISFLQIPRRR